MAGTADADMAAAAQLGAVDGMQAVRLVRARAAEFEIDPARIGFIGFSAGGNVLLRVVVGADAGSRPDFAAAIYAPARGLDGAGPPPGSGPMFILAATDDPLGLAQDSIELYRRWSGAGVPVELHLYDRGGHGFGMRTQGLPVDSWIERLGDWLESRALIDRRGSNG